MLIVRSKSTDVYRNLAVEEWLLDHAPSMPVLFLYVNDPCVVIGKNQNPWRECKLTLMDEEGVPLARRISGGGAVYHDPGNLNVSVMVPRTEYVEQKQYDLILQALEARGIRGSKMGPNSLAVEDRKFSGQAFCHRRERTLHHGTILVSTDLARLGRYLGPELDGIETKAVASVPANVVNLSQFAPELTVERLSEVLIEQFNELYGSDGVVECWADEDIHKNCTATQFLPIIGKISSKDWKLGHTPKFTFQDLEVERGRVVNIEGSPSFDDFLRTRSL
ncbi:MAG: lipoate--protein ligase [Kiritimatiellales bacterium]|nr:lipoate--protein ligase [Kiritimatiellota bacterium]MBL7011663.1 lipoate--protein ligase [Kiritimatiellales bacterium]